MSGVVNQIEGERFTTEARGVVYHLRKDALGRWELTSQRLALSAARMGGTVRHFRTLGEVSASVKAFRGVDILAAMA